MSIGVAIIGSGIFAKEQHLPAILATPDLSLKAIWSRTLESASKVSSNLSQKVDWYSDQTEGRSYDDLLTNPNIKAVIIALPIMAQPEFIRKALAAGKHVLSEKPIAPDLATAQDLIAWYRSSVDKTRVSWSVAENWRFMDSHRYAADEVKKLGRILGFRTKVNSMVLPGGKYYETAWRKAPEYQGGFLLDGGVHFVAATRLLLGEGCQVARVSAFTEQVQEHLPPIDTVNAIWKLKDNPSGTFSVSMGTTFKGSGYTIACEHGTVTVVRSRVTVAKTGGEEETKEFPDEGAGVKQEVKAWAEGIQKNEQHPSLFPEEALQDLEILESMFKSGERNGTAIELKLQ